MLTDSQIEKRCRDRLRRYGLKIHKVNGEDGQPYYYADWDDTAPENRKYADLKGLVDFTERFIEKNQS